MKKLIYLIIILVSINGCCSQKIANTPSNREIRKAMKYSDWRYTMPNPIK